MTAQAVESPFEVVAETVVSVELEAEDTPAVTFETGDKVRIADPAHTVYGGYVDTRAFGQIGELVSDRYLASEGWEVRFVTTYGPTTNYVGPEYLTKLTEADILREELAKAIQERDSAQALAATARDEIARQAAEHEAWKANLREVALEAAEENEMCGVFDRVMEKVGLEGRERTHSLRVEFSGAVYLEIEATSRQNALDQLSTSEIRDAITHGYVPDLDWNVDEDG